MKTLIIPIGPPGSGKTTLYDQEYSGYYHLSPDHIRFKLLDYPASGIHYDPAREQEVWREFYHTLDAVLEQDCDIYIDATNLTLARRKPLLARAREHEYKIVIVWFKLSLREISRRNGRRERQVPEHILVKQFFEMDPPEEYEYDEVRIIEAH